MPDGRRALGAGPTLAYEVVRPADSGRPAQPTLLCLHGNSSHRGIWRPVARELSEYGYGSVLLDLRGHGDSEHVSPPAYDPEHHAADLAAVVARLIDPPVAILAHSAAALAAARFMTDTRTSAATPPVAFVWVDLDPLVPRWQVEYFRQGAPSVGRVFATAEDAGRGVRRMYPKIAEDRLQSFVMEGLREVDAGFRMTLDPRTYETREPGDLRLALPDIPCPTLVLRGGESIVTSREGLVALANGLRTHEVREIRGGSHMLLLEQPEAVAAAVRDVLRRHAVAPSPATR
jgi:pimeloyl-ACP methyl ester carboxylesterase